MWLVQRVSPPDGISDPERWKLFVVQRKTMGHNTLRERYFINEVEPLLNF
jgi:hypothetical protein